jgi:hypothetical protein
MESIRFVNTDGGDSRLVTGTAGDFVGQYGCAPLALQRVGDTDFAMDRVLVMSDPLGESAVDQVGVSQTQFFVPRPVLGMGYHDVFQTARRKVFW